MLKKAVIIPTGDEIFEGIVIDTNSPALMGLLLEYFPAIEVKRKRPTPDRAGAIQDAVSEAVKSDADLVLITGGSGGGQKYDPSLARDCTHSAILKMVPQAASKEIYGLNGHLWSKLVVGRINNTLIITLPGPTVEALAGGRAAVEAIRQNMSEEQIVAAVAEAVLMQFPKGGEIR
ncbi:molybdopterin-binding protein [Zhaonella formicivorans]|uniref:molybdopterin-binding protein n=1 Tax=Zhaonella formicivorans TaxID=2528593 RepID=UPI0010CF8419|nr:molybdopterin-binding protein [Zhaonella formicivorans]